MNLEHEVIYFGCTGYAGHFIHRHGCRRPQMISVTPWNNDIDGGPLKRAKIPDLITDQYCTERKDGWTLIAFWDRSGDSRPGSHSTFVIHADIPSQELFALARAQWPEIFNRRGFPIR